jgi:hypothetical protein
LAPIKISRHGPTHQRQRQWHSPPPQKTLVTTTPPDPMAPLTRAHRAKASRNGEPIEPLSPALPLTSTPTPRRNHTRFDEDDTPTAAAATTTSKPEEIANLQSSAEPDSREIADSQENSDASESDDEAPEETSLGAGKEEALKRDEEARKAAEAYMPLPIILEPMRIKLVANLQLTL